MRRLTVLLALICASVPALAQPQAVVMSSAPDRASVTIYRDPKRSEGTIDALFPQGFALVSEKRRIALPAGESVIRFEGVADGMIAVSAVVTGLPGGVVQKNRDARLLSPAALVDGSLGHSVHLRRTNRQTGQVTEQDAIIRSTAANALVLETAEGVEGLRCSGLPEMIGHDALPAGLSTRPTLSVTTRSPSAIEADVTLTYLATGFDWGASYVARIAPDERSLDLFAWLTVANGNDAAFPRADLLAVAGRVNRNSDGDASPEPWQSPSLSLRCWQFDGYAMAEDGNGAGAPRPPPLSAPMAMAAISEDIVLTAQRRVAQQEDLGDLKLYRVPMKVDINPNAQKQVALLDKRGIPVALYYSARLTGTDDDPAPRPLTRMIRFANARQGAVGVPLPAGGVTVMTARGDSSLVLGATQMRDRAIGEMVELAAGASTRHFYTQAIIGRTDRRTSYRVMLTNAGASPITVEIVVPLDPGVRLSASGRRLSRRDGSWLWTVAVPANDTAQLDYSLVQPKE